MNPNRDPPTGWGEDPLTAHVARMVNNAYGTFVGNKVLFESLRVLDGLFADLLHVGDSRFAVSLLLANRSHSAFRAASFTAMSGSASEAYALMRLCLECAGYALLVRDRRIADIWLHRQDGDAVRKAARREFRPEAILRTLGPEEPKLATIFNRLYDQTIDMGAHPNLWSVAHGLNLQDDGTTVTFSIPYLHGRGVAFDLALKTAVRCGILALHILVIIFFEHAEARNAAARLIKMQDGY
jgi:hypothetical protein